MRILAIRSTLASARSFKRTLSTLNSLQQDVIPHSSLHAFQANPSLPPKTALRLTTRPVPEAPYSIASSPDAFFNYLQCPKATPLVFRACRTDCTQGAIPAQDDVSTPSENMLHALRTSSDRLVEVEIGRYDKVGPEDNRFEMPLGVYLDWLTSQRASSTAAEPQLYLAQWRALDEVPGLSSVVQPPRILESLFHSPNKLDLYQTSFFVGPTGAVTPLHRDPYHNVYNLVASSDRTAHGKHFLLLPPSSAEYLGREDLSVSRNTSQLDFHLEHSASTGSGFDVVLDPTPGSSRAAQAAHRANTALSCILHESDIVFVPRGWWHRVENVDIHDAAVTSTNVDRRGWTAGVGWWFLPRDQRSSGERIVH